MLGFGAIEPKIIFLHTHVHSALRDEREHLSLLRIPPGCQLPDGASPCDQDVTCNPGEAGYTCGERIESVCDPNAVADDVVGDFQKENRGRSPFRPPGINITTSQNAVQQERRESIQSRT